MVLVVFCLRAVCLPDPASCGAFVGMDGATSQWMAGHLLYTLGVSPTRAIYHIMHSLGCSLK